MDSHGGPTPHESAVIVTSPEHSTAENLAKLPTLSPLTLTQLQGNPFFTAGFGLAILGAAARYGSMGVRRGVELLKRRMLVDLEITRHDQSYDWILNWMTAHYRDSHVMAAKHKGHGVSSMTERLIRRLVPGLHHLQIQTATEKTANGAKQTLSPSYQVTAVT